MRRRVRWWTLNWNDLTTEIDANMLHLHSSPEDFAIDLSFLPNPAPIQNRPLKVSTRVILTPANAKRLLGMLAQGNQAA